MSKNNLSSIILKRFSIRVLRDNLNI